MSRHGDGDPRVPPAHGVPIDQTSHAILGNMTDQLREGLDAERRADH